MFSKLGVIKGYEEGTFKPNANITRGEFAAVIARTFNIGTGTVKAPFNDIDGNWAKDAIMALASNGIINGKGEGYFAPDKNSTRAEALTIMLRSIKLSPEIAALMDSLK